MSVGRVFFKKKPKNVVQGKSVDVGVRRIINKTTTPVIAGDSFEMDAVGALRLSPLRRGLTIDSTVDIFTFYVPQRHVYGEQWIKFMKDGFKAEDGMPDLIVTCVQTCAFLISSRRRHTRSDRDWSSDVCSSDLHQHAARRFSGGRRAGGFPARRRTDYDGARRSGTADRAAALCVEKREVGGGYRAAGPG